MPAASAQNSCIGIFPHAFDFFLAAPLLCTTLHKPLPRPHLSLPQGEPTGGRTAEGEEPCAPQHTHMPQKAPFGRAVQETNPSASQSLKENPERGNGPIRPMAIKAAPEQKGLHLVMMPLTCSDTGASLWAKPWTCFLSSYLHY